MKAILVYDTRFGNTEKITKALESGLKRVAGIETIYIRAGEITKSATTDLLKGYDLICIGAPTEGFTASKPMKEFLDKLKEANFADKYGFAYDTKIDSRLSGSAAKRIEKVMIDRGFKMIVARESALVMTVKDKGAISGARLKEGEDTRFEQIGERIGKVITSTQTTSA